MKIFTLSSGRSGTGWLSNFISQNTGEACLHEALDVDGYFTHTPCTKTLRWFNTYGYSGPVEQFWSEKMMAIAETANWFETSHLLGKAGLCEHLVSSKNLTDETTIIVLRRSLVKQCASYIYRNDFNHIANIWQFFLDYNYANNLVNFHDIHRVAGAFAYPIWYAVEMEARKRFYVRQYGGELRFIQVRLEELIHETGAASLMSCLGFSGAPELPAAANVGNAKVDDAVREEIEHTIEKHLETLGIDPH